MTHDIMGEIRLMKQAADIGEKWRREADDDRSDEPEGWDENMWAHGGNGGGL